MISKTPKTRAAYFSVLSTLIMVFAGSPLEAESVNSDLAAKIVEHMKEKFYDETDAEKKVAEWGDECVPLLIQMLKAGTGETEKVAFYLGKTKSASAVHPLIEYVERLLAAGDTHRFGYLALGWIGDEKALEYLTQAATDPRRCEPAIQGLEESGTRQALAALKKLESTLGANPPQSLASAITHCQETIDREEGLQKARSIKKSIGDLDRFWSQQEAKPSSKPAKEIIGEYTGTGFWTDYRKDNEINNVRIIFHKNGTFETNFTLLTNTERLQNQKTLSVQDTLVKGPYRVLSPTQLVLGPSEKTIPTFGFSLGDGHLSFFHKHLGAFFSLVKGKSGKTPVFSNSDIAGTYKGVAYIAEEGQKQLNKVDGVEIVFSENGSFSTNFGKKYEKLMRGFTACDGKYLIDPSGKLVCYTKVHGSDFMGGDAISFFDWHLREGALHVNHFQGAYYGCALALSLSDDPVNLTNTEILKKLTHGAYVGSAFRATPEGNIQEFPGIELTFSEDGTYKCNFQSKLQSGEQYYPSDDGPFCLLSDRQLYMADNWENNQLTNQGICDVLLSGDDLCFTSFRRNAYFVLKKKTE